MIKSLKNSYLAYFLMYHFYFLATALFSTLISIYLLDQHYTASQVSLLVSVAYFCSMFAQPLIGIFNARLGILPMTALSFLLIIVSDLFFIRSDQLWIMTVFYSLGLVFLNGVSPMLDVLATQSPYTFGKIRIWGTIGYSIGAQMAGWCYQYLGPSSIYWAVAGSMVLSLLGLCLIQPKKKQKAKKKKMGLYSLLQNKAFLYYLLLVALFSGVGNTGHTYIPSLLHESGLSVQMASTVVALSVIVEAPLTYFSYLFMDRIAPKILLILPLCVLLLQYLVFASPLPIAFKIGATLLSKHATGMLLIMVSLKIVANLVAPDQVIPAMALVQGVRYLGTIPIQQFSGILVEGLGYVQMSLFLASLVLCALLLALPFKIPFDPDKKLFS